MKSTRFAGEKGLVEGEVGGGVVSRCRVWTVH